MPAKTNAAAAVEAISSYQRDDMNLRARRARDKSETRRVGARSSISAVKAKKPTRSVGPTPERMAKGDIDVRAGFHRSMPPIERLRDGNKLDHDGRTNQAMFEAAQKLRRHFDGCMIGVKAQDLNRVIAGSSTDDLNHEEAWVHNYDQFRMACRLMGWSEASPHRGAGRIVVDVVCYETPVVDAARTHIGQGRTDTIMGAGMDRLREGLFALATVWRTL